MSGILVQLGGDIISGGHHALEIIRHRGPDSFGAVNFDTCCGHLSMGYRRLSIIDPDHRSNQPFSYKEGNLWIVFDGEIYNYLEIRRELISLGCEFRTQSDTEVILSAYSKWGKKCLQKFNGMFSFCIFDRKENKLFIARDRFGIKPLYFWNSAGIFCVASEIKQFTCISGFRAEANREKLYHFLNSGNSNFDNETLWNGVRELEPSSMAEIELSKWRPGRPVNTEKWYELSLHRTSNFKYGEAVEKFQDLLKDSIKLRIRSDVPVGFLLSGELDSSYLAGICTQISKKSEFTVRTFSPCYSNVPYDGGIENSGTPASIHFPTPEDVANYLDLVIWHNDIPVRHDSTITHWLSYKNIQHDIDSRKVIIEERGSNEILCGHSDFFWSMIYDLFRNNKIPAALMQLIVLLRKRRCTPKTIMEKLGHLALPSLLEYPANPALRHETLLGTTKVPDIPIRREQPSVKEMHRASLQMLRRTLHNVDRNSMAHSMEARVPFLDHRIVEFCTSLPDMYKVSNGVTKRLLKSSARNIIPEMAIDENVEHDIPSPIPAWLKSDILPFFRENIENAANLPFVNRDIVLHGVDEFLADRRPFDPTWWNLVTTDRWLKIFRISI